MATYERQIDNRRYVMSDDEAAAHMPAALIFTASRAQVPADGKSVIVIDAQLMTVPLSDEKRRTVKEVRTHVGLIIEGERSEIDLDANGHAQLEYAFDEPGEYVITTDGVVYSPGITIKAV